MKLSLRDLFWLVFALALLTMWWMDHSHMADRISFWERPKSVPASPAHPTLLGPLQPAMPPTALPPETPDWLKQSWEEWEREWMNPTPEKLEKLRRAHEGVI